MKFTLEGEPPTDPRQRVLALESAAETVCRIVGQDRADAVMALLTAAVHMSMVGSGRSAGDMLETLAHSLGCATVAADDFFGIHKKH